jgi:hypothetical protein
MTVLTFDIAEEQRGAGVAESVEAESARRRHQGGRRAGRPRSPRRSRRVHSTRRRPASASGEPRQARRQRSAEPLSSDRGRRPWGRGARRRAHPAQGPPRAASGTGPARAAGYGHLDGRSCSRCCRPRSPRRRQSESPLDSKFAAVGEHGGGDQRRLTGQRQTRRLGADQRCEGEIAEMFRVGDQDQIGSLPARPGAWSCASLARRRWSP